MSLLPESTRALVETIGEASVQKLIREWPRTACNGAKESRVIVYVPSVLPDSHRLIDVIGMDGARRLVQRFGGELVFLASAHRHAAHERRQQIARAVMSGLPRDRVAMHYGVSQRTVERAMPAMFHRGGAADDARMNTTNRASA